MIKAVEYLKNEFTNLNHITCLLHALHRVCENIREKFYNADKFIFSMKKILKNLLIVEYCFIQFVKPLHYHPVR
jgi:hypothetical protein